MRRTIEILTLAGALLAAGCQLGAGERGSGKLKSEARTLPPFTELDVGGAFELDVSVGERQSVELTSDENLLPLIETKVSGGKLTLGSQRPIDPTRLFFKAVVKDLSALDCSGAVRGTVTALKNARLGVHLSGAGSLTLQGKTGALSLGISGAGKVTARELEAEEVKVSVSGAAGVEVFASRALDVTLSGAGKVAYWGDPKEVKRQISGAGALVKK